MEQRRVRLGDIVDDYCPRERRVTNHAVVAMIEDEIRQTRCPACDADHLYKAAKIPRIRKKGALAPQTAVQPPPPDEAGEIGADEPVGEAGSAAGQGRRLRPYTQHMPKCMVPVGDRPLLRHQLDAFRAHGIREFVVIRGYLGHVLEARRPELGPGDVRFVDNPGYQHNNILQSLFCAERELDGPVLVTYSDILFTADVVAALLGDPGDIALVIDRDFASIYEGRTEHPLDEAEVADLDATGRVRRVGKRALRPAQAFGETTRR